MRSVMAYAIDTILWSSGAASTVNTGSASTTPVKGRGGPSGSRAKRRAAGKRQLVICRASISVTSRVKAYSSVRFQV